MATISYTNIKVKLGMLQPWDKNPRKISKEQAARLLKSFEKFGQAEAIVIGPRLKNGKYPLYNGHQRVTVLMAAYGKDYKVDARKMSRPLTEKERQQLTLYLHSGATGEFDWTVVLTWNKKYLTEWGGMNKELTAGWKAGIKAVDEIIDSQEPETVDAEPQIDRAKQLLKKWKVCTGDLWQIGAHRLLCGDSTSREDVERVMQGEKAEMTFIDPPYGVEYEGGAQNKKKREKLEGDDSGDLYMPILKMCKEFSNKSAPMYIWFASSVGKPVYDAVEAIGYKVRAMIVWNKLDAHYGAFMAQYMQKHEPCLYIVNGDASWKGANNEVTVWDVKQPSTNEFHPTQKPIELAMRAIGNHKAEIVIDFCLGSGTTLVACQNLGRKGRGIEISPAYCSVILERMQTAFPELEIKRVK